MTEEADKLLHSTKPEASGPHSNYEAYMDAIRSRLADVLADPHIGGTRGMIETLASDEPIEDREEFAARVLAFAYSKGKDDEHRSEIGQLDNTDIRVINNYRPADESQPSTEIQTNT